MPKAHVVFAHPEPHSLNGTLKNITLRVLQGKGFSVTCTDLFAENFSVYLDNKEYPGYTSGIYTVTDAQQHCMRTGTLPEAVQREQQLLVDADLVVFQFPMWWGTVPAPLKAYFEKVFMFNWSFGGAYNLQGKRTLVCSSVGTPETYWSTSRQHSIKTVYYHLFTGLFETMKMINLQPIIIYGFEHMTDDQKRRILADFEREIQDVDTRPLLSLSAD